MTCSPQPPPIQRPQFTPLTCAPRVQRDSHILPQVRRRSKPAYNGLAADTFPSHLSVDTIAPKPEHVLQPKEKDKVPSDYLIDSVEARFLSRYLDELWSREGLTEALENLARTKEALEKSESLTGDSTNSKVQKDRWYTDLYENMNLDKLQRVERDIVQWKRRRVRVGVVHRDGGLTNRGRELSSLLNFPKIERFGRPKLI
jgi:hypothetical protein